ncbi:MAG: enoyl-CoA hydratase, partial [Acidimicrobiia bacterium]
DGATTVQAALDYAHLLATSVGPEAVTVTKQQLYADLHRHDVAASVRESKELLDRSMGTAEYREGIAALRERRPPRF